MLDSVLGATAAEITLGQIVLCSVVSLVLGGAVVLTYAYKNTTNRNFMLTLALLPVIVQSVIMLVNGNLGAGVAVMGAFGLVRFRSVPGGAREITSIFFAMAIGLATGMGYVVYAALFTVLITLVMLVYATVSDGPKGQTKSLRVTIPEDIDYTTFLNDLFLRYTSRAELEKVKTINMGSLFELHYSIKLKDAANEKVLIDEIRKRNGNLSIICALQPDQRPELL